MSRSLHHVDRPFLFATGLLVIAGFFIFSSASLGLLARDGVQYSTVAIPQVLLGIGGGSLALFLLMNVPYRRYRQYAPYLFGAAVVLAALVFVPHLGYGANGARRWLDVFGWSFQPGEFLKIAFVLCLAWYYSTYHAQLGDIRYALGGLLVMLVAAGIPLLLQPDTGTFAIIGITGVAMSVAAGVKFRHLALLALVIGLGLTVVAFARPYVMDRITTFLHPTDDPRGSGYQVKQSLIAVGSGSVFGRGFGQSIQKFSYLPEPIGDSIFSVAAEEFGFLGSVILIGLFIFLAVRGLTIAARAPDRFGALTIVGIVILLTSQSFINIGSMLGLMPLTGEPLVFISHGGTSLLLALASVGVVLNISRYATSR